MSEEENFDEIIRQKFAEKEFVFNEENWEKAEKKMDSSRRSRKIIWWAAVFSIGLFSGMAVMLPFVIDKKEGPAPVMAELTKKEIPQEDTEAAGNAESTGLQLKENENTSLQTDIAGENKTEAQEIATTNNNSGSKSETLPDQVSNSGEDKRNFSLNESLQNEKPKTKITNSAPEYKAKEKQQEVFASSQQKKGNIEPTENNNTAGSKKKGLENTSTQSGLTTGANISVETNSNNNAEPVKKESSEIKNESGSETLLVQAPSAGQTAVQQNEIKNDSLVPGTNSLADLNKPAEVPLAAKDSADPKTNNSSPPASASKSNSPKAPKRGLASADILSIEAGTNYGFGWNYSDATEARGFNPIAGVAFTHYFNQDWAIYSGIQYGSLGHLTASQKIFSKKRYDFGYTAIDTIVDTKVLYYAVLPIQAQYHFNNRNALSIGGNISYLVNAKSDVTVNSKNNLGTAPVTEKSVMGYYAGAFKQWDASVAVSYRRKISEKFSVSASAYFGLIDIKSDAFFSRNRFERNSGLKLVLSYDLFQY